MKGLSVLSFGSTRGLWDGESAEDYQRMMGYAAHLDDYVIVANSYKQHGLRPRWLAPHVEAIPTDAFCGFDSFVRMLRIGRAVLRARKIHLIQAQDPFYLGLVAVLLGKWFRLPVNVCVYGPNVYDKHWRTSHWSHRLLAPFGRWVLSRCHGVQVDGRITAERLVAAGFPPARLAVKKMVPANLERFLQIDRATRKAPGAPTRLLFVGRLAAQKNLRLLCQAATLLLADGAADFEIVLVGEGPEEAVLHEIVARENLQACVKFHGAVARDEIVAVFAQADAFVLTSDFEGYPRVLMEAAAAALPIVTTAVSGADEAVLDGETGYIVPVGDPAAVAGKLAALLADGALRAHLGRAGREHIRGQLDPRTNTPGQVAIWKKIAASNGVSADGAVVAGKAGTRRQEKSVKHLLLFNLVTDAGHPILGFTTQWIRVLAERVESIDVLTMCAGVIDVPSNVRVHSAGRERGYSEPRRVLEFYRHLFRILRERRIDGCFSHMIEVFSVLAGPVLWAKGIPLVTWYAHPQLNPTLKLAHRFSQRMVTSLPKTYPYRKDKLVVIGQGIDTTLFTPAAAPAIAEDDLVLCAGRLSRVKNHPTLLRAIALLPGRVRVTILGATAGADDETYVGELRRLTAELGLQEAVTFQAPVPPAQLPASYRRCAVHVNLTPAGFGDKVAWEAMSCGRPCLVANEDFRETLGQHAEELLFRGDDPADLAEKLAALLARSAAERAMIGLYLRSQVERLHALPRLAERILAELSACSALHA